MRIVLVLWLCALPQFLWAQDDTPITPRIAIKVALSESIETHEVTVEFLEVLEDSRCPKDVECLWAGRARVKVKVSRPDTDSEILEITLGKNDSNVLYTDENYVLRAAALTPYPTTENSGTREYALLVVEEKL
ncbi:MAG: hypothetical protein AAF466_06715 [Bacteroidota bacterium]